MVTLDQKELDTLFTCSQLRIAFDTMVEAGASGVINFTKSEKDDLLAVDANLGYSFSEWETKVVDVPSAVAVAIRMGNKVRIEHQPKTIGRFILSGLSDSQRILLKPRQSTEVKQSQATHVGKKHRPTTSKPRKSRGKLDDYAEDSLY